MPRKSSRSNPELEALRAEVKRMQRNANAKVSRLRRLKGIEIKGTSYDARADVKKFATYTTKQLIARAKKLEAFTSRSNAFVAGAAGQPLPKSAYDRYKALEAAHNRIGEMRAREREHFQAPGSGMTIGERNKNILPDNMRSRGDVLNRPYSKIERSPENINGAGALDKLIKDMSKKLKHTPSKVLQGQRDNLGVVLETIGNDSLMKDINGLTLNQFDILFNDTKFAADLYAQYGIMQKMAAGTKERWYASVVEDHFYDLLESIKWAKTLPGTAQGKG